MNDEDEYEDEDTAFPQGDGTADDQATVSCPYCGEPVDIVLDPGSGPEQGYVEDCPVCCRPWNVRVVYGAAGEAEVTVEPADDAGDRDDVVDAE